MANEYTNLSPGVYISEKDLSVRIRIAVSTTGAMVFESARGPMKPTFTSSQQRHLDLYGPADPQISFAHDCAAAFLIESSQLWNQRVINGALHAGVTYFIDKNSKNGAAGVNRIITVPFPIGRVGNYEAGSRPLVILAFADNLITANVFACAITDGATLSNVSVTFATNHNTTMTAIASAINTAMATYGSGGQATVYVEQVTGANNYVIMIYPPNGVTLLFNTPTVTLGVTQTTAVFDTDARILDVMAENPGTWANNYGVKITNVDKGVRQRWLLTFSGPLVTGNTFNSQLNSITGPSITPVAFDTDSDETMDDIAAAYRALTDYVDDAYVVTAPGALDNDRQIVVIAKAAAPDAMKIVSAAVTGGAGQASVLIQETLRGIITTGEFDLEIFSRANTVIPVERYRVSMANHIDAYGTQTKIDYRVNAATGSLHVRVIVPETARTHVWKTVASGVTNVVDQVIRWMGGGTDGVKVLNSQIANGWNVFINRELIPVRLLINAGYTSPTVHQAMISLAERRYDAVAILDMPSDKQLPQAAYDYRVQDINIDSSYGAIYTPDLLVTDDKSDDLRYIPPSGHVAGAYAYSDGVSALWFAPAGLNRGKLKRVRGLRYDYNLGDRELLDPVGVNCIIDKPGAGPTIWGEETLQWKKSVLSAVHARRLLNALEVGYADALDYVALFEPNNVFTRFSVEQVGIAILEPIKSAGGLYDYEVVCDERNNPPETIDQDILRVDMYLQIVRTAKRVLLRAVLTPTGANFSELIALVNGNSSSN